MTSGPMIRMLHSTYNNIVDGAKLGLTFPLRHVSAILGRKYHVTRIKRVGAVRLRTHSTDATAFVQVFRKREYDIFTAGCGDQIMSAYQRILETGQMPIVIDAGANVGAAAIWFAKLFPASLVLAVEPDPGNAEVCRHNTRQFRNVRVIEAAIGSEGGRVSLTNHPSKEQWCIRTTRNDNGGVYIYPVSTLMLESPHASKLFLIKIDIEGFESDLFAKNTHWMDETDVIIIEPHDRLYKGSSRNFQQEIARRRFDMFISGENLIYVKTAAS